MDFIGGVAGGDWNSDLLPQFLANSWVSNELNGIANLQISSSLWPACALNMLPSIDEAFFCASETWGGNFLNANCLLRDSQSSIDLCFDNLRNTDLFYRDGADLSLRPINESNILENEDLKSRESENGPLEDQKKRHLIEEKVSETRNRRSKKKQKIVCSSKNNEEGGNGGKSGQSTSDCHSEDDSTASQESTPKSCSLIGKARATRGSATDPQSLYARKRRERINEKLRTLQNLVPSGTKVDISTMLEEAVHYVKFLQLQIKLLSSDEMWMYAPIAYNGMDLGLHTTQSQKRD